MFKYYLVPDKLYHKLKSNYSEHDLRELAGAEKVSSSLEKHIDGVIYKKRALSSVQNKPFESSSEENMDTISSAKRKYDGGEDDEEEFRKRFRPPDPEYPAFEAFQRGVPDYRPKKRLREPTEHVNTILDHRSLPTDWSRDEVDIPIHKRSVVEIPTVSKRPRLYDSSEWIIGNTPTAFTKKRKYYEGPPSAAKRQKLLSLKDQPELPPLTRKRNLPAWMQALHSEENIN